MQLEWRACLKSRDDLRRAPLGPPWPNDEEPREAEDVTIRNFVSNGFREEAESSGDAELAGVHPVGNERDDPLEGVSVSSP